MIRGTTPTHTFNIPFDVSLIDKVRVTYSQCDRVVLMKSMEDCRFEGNAIVLKLSQDDTLLFDELKVVRIQLSVLTMGGDCLKSDIESVSVGECLDDEVLA